MEIKKHKWSIDASKTNEYADKRSHLIEVDKAQRMEGKEQEENQKVKNKGR